MPDEKYAFTPPKLAPLRWLADPGREVSSRMSGVLLGELFASPKAVVAGVLNGLILNLVALYLHGGGIFAFFMLMDVVLAAGRVAVAKRALQAARRGLPTPTDLFLITAASWCALQGGMAFAAMQTDVLPLQLLSATTAMGLIGPICARNYAAPRYAMTLVALCDLPFVAGAALSGNRWLLILVLQTPLFLFGVSTIIRRFQGMAIATLKAEQESHHRARHDPLTGLLNRFGLAETLDCLHPEWPGFMLFYLDLDGFKPINDTFGHQTGDRILQAVADRLRSTCRAVDVISRLGGDEFVIVRHGHVRSYRCLLRAGDHRGYRERTLSDRHVRTRAHRGSASAPPHARRMVGWGTTCTGRRTPALYEAKAAGKGTHRHFTTRSRSESGLVAC